MRYLLNIISNTLDKVLDRASEILFTPTSKNPATDVQDAIDNCLTNPVAEPLIITTTVGEDVYNTILTQTDSGLVITGDRIQQTEITKVLLNFEDTNNFTLNEAIDGCGVNIIGTAIQSAVETAYGTYSCYCDGITGYLITDSWGHLDFRNKLWTIDFSLYTESVVGNNFIMDKRETQMDGTGFCLYNDNGQLYFYASGDFAWVGLSVCTLTTNTWNKVKISRSATAVSTYLNDTLVNEHAIGVGHTIGDTTTGIAILGSHINGQYGMAAYIDCVRITVGAVDSTSTYPLTVADSIPVLNINDNVVTIEFSSTSFIGKGYFNDGIQVYGRIDCDSQVAASRLTVGNNSFDADGYYTWSRATKTIIKSAQGGYGQLQILNPDKGEVTIVLAAEIGGDADTIATTGIPPNQSYVWAFGIGNYGLDPNYFNIGNNALSGGIGFCLQSPTGWLGIGCIPESPVDINNDILRIRNPKTISTETDTGLAGEICWDGDYINICITNNLWRRIPLAWSQIGGAHTATVIAYDNDTSGLTAEDVQSAIDELASTGGGGGYACPNLGTTINGLYPLRAQGQRPVVLVNADFEYTTTGTGLAAYFDTSSGNTPACLQVVNDGATTVSNSVLQLNPQSGYVTVGPVGYVTPTARFTVAGDVEVTANAVSGVRETIATFTTTDSAGSALIIGNGTVTNGVYVPSIIGYSASNRVALHMWGVTDSANDTGTEALIKIIGCLNDDPTHINGTLAPIVTRPILNVFNSTTSLFKVEANGTVQILGTITDGTHTKTIEQISDHIDGHTQAETTITFTDVTTNDANTTNHGYLPKLSGTTSTFLRGDGTWSAVGAAQYVQYGFLGGYSLSDSVNKTGLWEYIGGIVHTANMTYSFGSTGCFEVFFQEETNTNSTTLEQFKVTFKYSLGTYADVTAFSTAIPGLEIVVEGDTSLNPATDIVGLVYSSSTTSKVIRFYYKYPNNNKHYTYMPLTRYGTSYNSAGAVYKSTTVGPYFYYVSGNATAVSLPTPPFGSLVYGTYKSFPDQWLGTSEFTVARGDHTHTNLTSIATDDNTYSFRSSVTLFTGTTTGYVSVKAEDLMSDTFGSLSVTKNGASLTASNNLTAEIGSISVAPTLINISAMSNTLKVGTANGVEVSNNIQIGGDVKILGDLTDGTNSVSVATLAQGTSGLKSFAVAMGVAL